MAAETFSSQMNFLLNGLKLNLDASTKGIAKLMGDYYLKSFSNESFDGKNWADLSDGYAKRKAKEGYTGGILVREGDLSESLLVGIINAIDSASFANGIHFVVSDVKASYHNSNERAKGVPKRQFMGESEALNMQIIAYLEAEIEKQFR